MHGRRDDVRVFRQMRDVRVEEVAEQREADFRIAVGEVLRLEVIERLLHRLHAAEQRMGTTTTPR